MMSVKLCAELVEACALRQAQGTTFAGSGHNFEGIGVSSGRFAVRPQRFPSDRSPGPSGSEADSVASSS